MYTRIIFYCRLNSIYVMVVTSLLLLCVSLFTPPPPHTHTHTYIFQLSIRNIELNVIPKSIMISRHKRSILYCNSISFGDPFHGQRWYNIFDLNLTSERRLFKSMKLETSTNEFESRDIQCNFYFSTWRLSLHRRSPSR